MTPAEIKRFALAGKATLTFESHKSGDHFTYQINKADDASNLLYFVGLLTGPNNETDFTYIGILSDRNGYALKLTKKSKLPATAKPVAAFNWVWNDVLANREPRCVTVHHEGSCGRCGRTLTTPESIDRGIGPECAKVMGLIEPKPRRSRKRVNAPF